MDRPSLRQVNLAELKRERLKRSYSFLHEENLDLLLVGSTDSIQSRGNVRYLTNYATVYGNSLAILANQSEPILLVPSGSFQLGWAKDMAWSGDIRAVNNYLEAFVSEVARLGVVGGRVGLAGLEDFPGQFMAQLEAALPEVQFKPVSRSFKLMKADKTEAETDMVRASVALADRALSVLPGSVRVGTLENVLIANTHYQLAQAGAEDYFVLASSGLRTVSPIPSRRSLEERDVLRVSIEPASQGGFWTQTIRTFCLDKPDSKVEAAFELCSNAVEAAEKKLKPGFTGGEIARDMVAVLKKSREGRIGPLGHGMGLDLTEPPFLLTTDETILRPGMVVTVHPSLIWGEVSIWMGDTYLVTEDKPEKLSKLPNTLTIL
jgi:Xaa-Pro aminopeptidase